MGRALSRLWVNGEPAGLESGELEVETSARWRVRARLGRGHPFRQEVAVAAVLDDGSTVHGRGILAAADGDDVIIEGTDGLE